MTLNHSRPEGSIISQREGQAAYVAKNLAEWQAGAASRTGTIVNGKTIGDPVQIATNLQTIQDALNGIAIGATNNGTVKYQTNFFGSYDFTQGALKGFTVGAGAQYRGKRKNGSVDAQLMFNTTAPTVAQNKAAAFNYLYGNATEVYTAFVSYNTRLNQKVRARFQLNIANLLNNDKPQWTSYSVLGVNALPTGNPRVQLKSGFTQFDPRKFTLTTTFNF